MKAELKGIMPAIGSPCNENDLFLEDEFAEHATRLFKQGVHGLYVCGATGDGYNMLAGERKRAAEIAVDIAKKFDGKVIVHVGASNTRDAVDLAEHAASIGAAAVSSMPAANRNLAQLISYYTDIYGASQLPLLVYHIPILTGHSFTVEQMLRLLDIKGVMGFKFSDWSLFFMKRVLLAKPDITVFNGNDEFLCPGLLYGATGGIGMNYNFFPKLFLGIYEAVSKGKIAKAMELQNLFLAYANTLWKYGIREGFTILMRQLGYAEYSWRRPRPVIDEPTRKLFLAEMKPKLEAIEHAC